MAPLRYRTGEIIMPGDVVEYHGDRGHVDYVVNGPSGDPQIDWSFRTNGTGVLVIEPRHFGRVYIRDIENDEDLVFVSRTSIPGNRQRMSAVDPSATHGKRLAMIAYAAKATGEDDVVVFTGLAAWDGTTLTMRREPAAPSFVVPAEWLLRIQPVQADLRETLSGADYQFAVTIGNMDQNDDTSLYRSTGLRWPKDGEA